MRKYIPAVLLLLGLCLLLYPTVSGGLNVVVQNQDLKRYRKAVFQTSPDTRQALLEASETQEDPSLLAVDDSGIIGSVAIPALRTELPVYAGTGKDVLEKGAGLLEGSSLPLGGEGYHSVLSAHRGLPESRLFRDLDKLAVGDIFTVTVLGQAMTYRIDQILTAEPEDTEALLPVEGLDLCTLLTCTPYGINSHRLLVRGRRIFL